VHPLHARPAGAGTRRQRSWYDYARIPLGALRCFRRPGLMGEALSPLHPDILPSGIFDLAYLETDHARASSRNRPDLQRSVRHEARARDAGPAGRPGRASTQCRRDGAQQDRQRTWPGDRGRLAGHCGRWPPSAAGRVRQGRRTGLLDRRPGQTHHRRAGAGGHHVLLARCPPGQAVPTSHVLPQLAVRVERLAAWW